MNHRFDPFSAGWWGVTPPPEQYVPGSWYGRTITITTDNTQAVAAPVDEDQARRIVREEIADLLPIDVPDFPPDD